MKQATAKIVLIALSSIFAVSLIIFSGTNWARTDKLTRLIEERTDRIFGEIEESGRTSGRLLETVNVLSHDSNELRRSLGLPPRDYRIFLEEDRSVSRAGNEKFFIALDRILRHDTELRKSGFDLKLSRDTDFQNLAKAAGLTLRRSEDGQGDFILTGRASPGHGGEPPILTIGTGLQTRTAGGKGGEEYVMNFSAAALSDLKHRLSVPTEAWNGKTLSGALGEEKWNDLKQFLDTGYRRVSSRAEEYENLSALFKTIPNDPGILRKMNDVGLRFSALEQTDRGVGTEIITREGREAISLSLSSDSLLYMINGETFKTFELFRTALESSIAQADLRTERERIEDEGKRQILSVLDDPGFSGILRSHGLSISREPREGLDYYYFDLADSAGGRKGSFAVQHFTGDIYLMDSEDIMITSLRTVTTDFSRFGQTDSKKKMTLPDEIPVFEGLYSSKDTVTLLLCGVQEKNADAIILLHGNKIRNEAVLINIPRDIWYERRRINSYYHLYGPRRFKTIISDVTGLKIDGYVSIDMYAFIDVVDILGGITVELREDLYDPSYRVRDNGEWSVLNYPKGIHTLGGREALRIARSRHTSSDFERADRQQLIIEGLKQRFDTLDIGDAGKVVSLFNVLSDYVDTSFSPLELARLFHSYRSVSIASRSGLNTDNVLYTTYSNVYRLEDPSIAEEEGFNKGAWILLPENDDWNIIRWYVRKLIEGDVS